MSPLKLLKRGIEQGSWDDVCESYESLTGEAIEVPAPSAKEDLSDKVKLLAKELGIALNEEPQAETVKTVGKKKPGKKKEVKISVKDLEGGQTEAAVSKVSSKLLKQELGKTGSGAVNAKGRKPIFVGGEIADASEAEFNKKVSKKLSPSIREEYEPEMVKCTQCSEEFNFHKSYPAGKLDSKGSPEKLCPNCLANKPR